METSGGPARAAPAASARPAGQGAVALDERRRVGELLEDRARAAGLGSAPHLGSGWAASSAIASPIASASRSRVSQPLRPARPSRSSPPTGRGEHRPVVHAAPRGPCSASTPTATGPRRRGRRGCSRPPRCAAPCRRSDARSLGRHQLELLRASRRPAAPCRVSPPSSVSCDVRAREPGDRTQQVLHALAALEPPEVEQPQRLAVAGHLADPGAGPRSRRGTRPGASPPGASASRAVEPLVGPEHVAAGPEHRVGAAQAVALGVEDRHGGEVVREVPVEHRARCTPWCGAARRVGSARATDRACRGPARSRSPRRGSRRTRSCPGRDRGKPRAGPVDARAVRVHVGEVGAPVLAVWLLDEHEPHRSGGRRGSPCAREPLVLLPVARARDDRDLGHLRELPRRRCHDGGNPPSYERVELPCDEGHPHDGPSYQCASALVDRSRLTRGLAVRRGRRAGALHVGGGPAPVEPCRGLDPHELRAGRLGTRRWCGTGTSGSRRAFGSRSWTSPRAIYRRSSRGTTPGACASSRAWPAVSGRRSGHPRDRRLPGRGLRRRARSAWPGSAAAAHRARHTHCTPVRRCAPPSTTPPTDLHLQVLGGARALPAPLRGRRPRTRRRLSRALRRVLRSRLARPHSRSTLPMTTDLAPPADVEAPPLKVRCGCST